MQIRHVIIKVDEQDKALSFYTSIVGFVKRLDLPIGRILWLTVNWLWRNHGRTRSKQVPMAKGIQS